MEAPPVQYVTTSDGYNIAFATCGDGRPFVYMPGQWSHIHQWWNAETYLLPWFKGLASRFRLVQYDGRGQGMSTRGLREDQTLESLGQDLEAVIQRLALEDFVLMAQWHSCHIAVRYAVAHPDRVAALVLVSCSARQESWPLGMYGGLPHENWDAFLISQLARNFQPEQAQAALSRIRHTITQEDYELRAAAFLRSNIEGDLPRLKVPTLVLHPRDFVILPSGESMKVAAQIENARVALIEGEALPGDAASGLAAIDTFIETLTTSSKTNLLQSRESHVNLSHREREVLRLLAAGRSNQQIADELVISVNTVIRHVSNVFAKTGVANRAQAAIYARDHGLF